MDLYAFMEERGMDRSVIEQMRKEKVRSIFEIVGGGGGVPAPMYLLR